MSNIVVAKDGSGQYTTIQAGLNAAQAGDTIQVKNGTYDPVTIPRSGTSSGVIHLTAYQGHTPVIDAHNQESHHIYIGGKNYIHISGLTLQNSSGKAYGIAGVDVHHIWIESCLIKRTGSSGINITGTPVRSAYSEGNEDIIIERNELVDTNWWQDASGQAWMEGLEVNSTYNFVIRNNKVGSSKTEGISTGKSAYGRVYGNIVTGIRTSPTPHSTVAIYIGGSCHHIDVFSNLLKGRSNGIIIATERGTPIEYINVFNNVFVDTTIGIRVSSYGGTLGSKKAIHVINNTDYGSDTGFLLNNQPMSDIVFRNNLSIGNSLAAFQGMTLSGATADHNISSGSPFVNAAGGDFHLKTALPGSSVLAPSFDFEGNTRGNPPDVGAYEYGGTAPPTPLPSPIYYNIRITNNIGGTVVLYDDMMEGSFETVAGNLSVDVPKDSVYRIEAIPDQGYRFEKYIMDGGIENTISVITATANSGDKTYQAYFLREDVPLPQIIDWAELLKQVGIAAVAINMIQAILRSKK